MGKLKMKGDVGVEEDLGPRVAEGLAASTEQEVASTWDSNCSSWPMKLKLGEMILRRCLTKSKASSRRTRFFFIRYARQIVADREMPAWQCTRTRPLESLMESEERAESVVKHRWRSAVSHLTALTVKLTPATFWCRFRSHRNNY